MLPEVEQRLPVDLFMTSLFKKTFNCSYLPSRNSSYSCFYKPVMCDSPPNITEITVIDVLNRSLLYTGGMEVEYACADGYKDMSGSNKVTCLYNGEWSRPPMCISVTEVDKILLKVLPPVFCSFVDYLYNFFYHHYPKKT